MSDCTSLENGTLRAGTQWLRRVLRSEYEGAREKACDIAKTEAFEMLFAHLARAIRRHRRNRLRRDRTERQKALGSQYRKSPRQAASRASSSKPDLHQCDTFTERLLQ